MVTGVGLILFWDLEKKRQLEGRALHMPVTLKGLRGPSGPEGVIRRCSSRTLIDILSSQC
jgi:hypothetical protein